MHVWVTHLLVQWCWKHCIVYHNSSALSTVLQQRIAHNYCPFFLSFYHCWFPSDVPLFVASQWYWGSWNSAESDRCLDAGVATPNRRRPESYAALDQAGPSGGGSLCTTACAYTVRHTDAYITQCLHVHFVNKLSTEITILNRAWFLKIHILA